MITLSEHDTTFIVFHHI